MPGQKKKKSKQSPRYDLKAEIENKMGRLGYTRQFRETGGKLHRYRSSAGLAQQVARGESCAGVLGAEHAARFAHGTAGRPFAGTHRDRVVKTTWESDGPGRPDRTISGWLT